MYSNFESVPVLKLQYIEYNKNNGKVLRLAHTLYNLYLLRLFTLCKALNAWNHMHIHTTMASTATVHRNTYKLQYIVFIYLFIYPLFIQVIPQERPVSDKHIRQECMSTCITAKQTFLQMWNCLFLQRNIWLMPISDMHSVLGGALSTEKETEMVLCIIREAQLWLILQFIISHPAIFVFF